MKYSFTIYGKRDGQGLLAPYVGFIPVLEQEAHGPTLLHMHMSAKNIVLAAIRDGKLNTDEYFSLEQSHAVMKKHNRLGGNTVDVLTVNY